MLEINIDLEALGEQAAKVRDLFKMIIHVETELPQLEKMSKNIKSNHWWHQRGDSPTVFTHSLHCE